MSKSISAGMSDTEMNSFFDDKLNSAITKLKAMSNYTRYTVKDLDKLVNNEETLREYIRNTEKEFSLEQKMLDNISDNELNDYVTHLDLRWASYF